MNPSFCRAGVLSQIWNTFEPNLVSTYYKLRKLGFRDSNGEVFVEEVEKGGEKHG